MFSPGAGKNAQKRKKKNQKPIFSPKEFVHSKQVSGQMKDAFQKLDRKLFSRNLEKFPQNVRKKSKKRNFFPN